MGFSTCRNFGQQTRKSRKMAKALCLKFEGNWIQTKAVDMDPVLEALGQGWVARKTAATMTVRTTLKVDDKGLHFSTKTILKSFDSFIPFEGSHDNPGLSDEPCPTSMEVLAGEKFSVTAKNCKAGDKLVVSHREFYLEDGQLVMKQTVAGKTGLRYFKKE